MVVVLAITKTVPAVWVNGRWCTSLTLRFSTHPVSMCAKWAWDFIIVRHNQQKHQLTKRSSPMRLWMVACIEDDTSSGGRYWVFPVEDTRRKLSTRIKTQHLYVQNSNGICIMYTYMNALVHCNIGIIDRGFNTTKFEWVSDASMGYRSAKSKSNKTTKICNNKYI